MPTVFMQIIPFKLRPVRTDFSCHLITSFYRVTVKCQPYMQLSSVLCAPILTFGSSAHCGCFSLRGSVQLELNTWCMDLGTVWGEFSSGRMRVSAKSTGWHRPCSPCSLWMLPNPLSLHMSVNMATGLPPGLWREYIVSRLLFIA